MIDIICLVQEMIVATAGNKASAEDRVVPPRNTGGRPFFVVPSPGLARLRVYDKAVMDSNAGYEAGSPFVETLKFPEKRLLLEVEARRRAFDKSASLPHVV